MKNVKQIFVIIFMLAFILSISSINAFAATVTQDNLEVTLVTDKEKYSENEQIKTTLTVKNNNDTAVTNVDLETALPDGYKLADKSENKKTVDSIAAGESVSLDVTLEKDNTKKDSTPSELSTDSKSSTNPVSGGNSGSSGNSGTTTGGTTTSGSAVQTGQTFLVIGIALLIVLMAAFFIVFVCRKNSLKCVWKNTISLVLCFCLVGGTFLFSNNKANAEEISKSKISIETGLVVNNNKTIIKSNISYNAINKSEYTVSFDLNYEGAPKIDNKVVKANTILTDPPVPDRDNYEFIGWFENKEEMDWKNSFDFINTPINHDMALYALWVDISQDTDQDGLSDDLEKYIGTDISKNDTDGDGLSDYQEKVIFNYNPLEKDSDNDGINDGDEDHDGDNITNLKEYEIGTDPILLDTDNDGLNDFEELNTYKTDPVDSDTDKDGANDGDEIRLGTNPLVSDSKFTESVSFGEISDSQPISVNVKTDISGKQVGTLKIKPASYSENHILSPTTPGLIGNAVDITIDGTIDSAEISFTYDTSLGELSEEFQPRIYYYNEETFTFDELPNQTVENGKVTASISHFSKYLLLNKVEFDKVWNNEIKKPVTDGTGANYSNIDVAFAIDVSGSMRGSKMTTAKNALSSFVDALEDNDRAGLIKFEDDAEVVSGLTSDKTTIKSEISSLYANGGTAMYKGLNYSLDLLTDSGETYGYKMIVVLSDGKDEPSTSYEGYYADLVDRAKSNNIIVYTVDVGSGIDTSKLTRIAEETGGKYYYASYASEINDVFYEIQKDTIDLTTDKNNDKIPDYYNDLIKSGEMVLSNGSSEFIGIDFNYNENGEPSNDYDGDGVVNGDELIIKENGNRVYAVMISDPMMTYSDSDEYSDFAEKMMGTDPMVPTYLESCIDYPMNDDNFIYVDILNTEDKVWNKAARNLWSSITFNWDHQDEAKSLITSFFKNYHELDSIKSMSNDVEKEMSQLLAEEAIDSVCDRAEVNSEISDDVISFKKAIKRWKSSGNSAKNLSSSHFTQFKAQVGQFTHTYPTTKFNFKGISKLDWAGMGISFVIDESIDIKSWLDCYSGIVSTEQAFIESEDILNAMINNDNAKVKFVSRAASDIKLSFNGDYQNFINQRNHDLELATAQNIASLAFSILSSANPYIKAVDVLIKGLDLITPTTKIAEATYHLYVVDEIASASKSLVSYSSKTNGYYNIENDQKRPLEILISARMYGGEFAKKITGSQIYINIFKTDEFRRSIAEACDTSKSRLQAFLNMLA